jgi:hypothetical protein
LKYDNKVEITLKISSTKKLFKNGSKDFIIVKKVAGDTPTMRAAPQLVPNRNMVKENFISILLLRF